MRNSARSSQFRGLHLSDQVGKSGNVIDAILETARTEDADLIVMATDGRDGFLDAFRGSHSERVLRQAPCPLLAIPESSYIGQAVAEEMSAAPVR